MAEGLSLGKQVGPLPLGVWLLVAAGGLGLGYVINKNASKKSGEPVQLAESGVGAGGSGFDVVQPPATPQTPVIETNHAWGRQVVTWLITQGVDPSKADNMIRKYLNGQSLDNIEQAMINLALPRFGPPPEPLPPVNQPGPAPTPELGTVSGLRVLSKSGNHIHIGWDPTPGATQYRLRASSALGPSARIPITSDTQYNWWPLSPGKLVTLTVEAGNGSKWSAAAQVQATTDNRP